MSGTVGPFLPINQISTTGLIRIERILPAPGQILVHVGETVQASQTIARISKRGDIQVLNVARSLGLENRDLTHVMVKKPGDRVEAGEVLAARQGVLPFLHKPYRSPHAGRLVAITHGWVMLEAETDFERETAEQDERPDLLAFVSGQVVDVTDQHSVTIETFGTHIIGACGLGGESNGVLQMAVDNPGDTLIADDIGMGTNNAILVGGCGVSHDALELAKEMQVKGIIVGGISSTLHELTPALPFPIVATEGYGILPMSSSAFDILRQLEGREVSISGQMGDAWHTSRPGVLIPIPERQQVDERDILSEDMSIEAAQIGHRVRVVRRPLFGQVGEIAAIPATPQLLSSGLVLPGAQVAMTNSASSETSPWQHTAISAQGVDGSRQTNVQFVPWLNLERI